MHNAHAMILACGISSARHRLSGNALSARYITMLVRWLEIQMPCLPKINLQAEQACVQIATGERSMTSID